MKKVLIIGCILFACALVCCGVLVGGYIFVRNSQPQVQAKVVVETGAVTVKHNNATVSVQASSDLYEGDEVTTDASSTANVMFVNNSITRMNTGTDLVITKVQNDATTIDIQVLAGQVWNRVEKVVSGGEFNVQGNGVVAAVRGTVFDFNTSGSDRKARISVFKGTVGVNDQQNNFQQDVPADNFADISKAGKRILDKMENSPLDANWVSSNQTKDTIIENFLQNHPKLFDALQELYPDKFSATSTDSGLLGNSISALTPLDSNSQWSEASSRQMCEDTAGAQRGLQALQTAGNLLFGGAATKYVNILQLYLNDCSDGVMSQQEYTAIMQQVQALKK